MRIFLPFAAFVAMHLVFGSPLAAEPRTQSILVLQQWDTRGPFPAAIYSALRSTINQRSPHPVSIHVENLDLSRFGGQTYEESLQAHLKTKYGDKPIGVIVAIGAATLDYVLRRGAVLWPGVPVVFAMIDQPTISSMTLPSNVTGSIMRLDFADMLQAARAVVPNLKSIALVGDAFKYQTAYRHFQQQIPLATKDLAVIDLMGLPMNELRVRTAQLPDHSAILYLAIYSDGRGISYPPGQALSLLGEAANRPIVVSAETLLNGASVGGFVMMPAAIGERAAHFALRVLDGENVSAIPATLDNIVKPIFDWRQLKRWNVNFDQLPPGSEIRYRAETPWDLYRWYIIIACAVLLLLTVLFVILIYEHQSRLRAELKANQRMSELARINRQATAGEMSAAIAHELNQPLGAILNNAETAAIILNSTSPDIDELKELLTDIRRDDQRASEIIKRLRALITKQTNDFHKLDLNRVTREALAVADIQGHANGITIHDNLAQHRLIVAGDPIQLQQVVLNLAINGMEAIIESPNGRRDIVARTALAEDNQVEFSISDFGAGIPDSKMKYLFDPFFTTKQNGMGMGLSLARTIIEAHHGTIWAENGITGGAIFRFRLPLVSASLRR